MTLRPPALAVLLAFAAGAAFAQSAEVRSAAERYVALLAVQAMMDDMLDHAAITHQLLTLYPETAQAPPELIDRASLIIADELQKLRPWMERAMADAAARHFTLEEIEAMTDYARSPLGESILRKTQPFMTDYLSAVGPEFQASMGSLAERLAQEFAR
jgi:uncharacterized protein